MRRALFLVVLWLAAALAASAKTGTIAMITDLSGKGEAVLSGRPVPARVLLRLSSGDELRLDAEARLRLVFFSNGQWQEAHGPCSVRLSDGRIEILSGDPGCLRAGPSSGAVFNVPEGNLDKIGGVVARAVPSLHLTMPHAVSDTPLFRWECDSLGPYTVTVSSGAYELWKQQTTSRQLLYAGPVQLSEDTAYSWKVAFPEGPFLERRFVILSPTSRQEVQNAERAAQALIRQYPDDPSPYVLMAAFYTDYYMLEEALQATLRASELRPRDAELHLALSRIYAEMAESARAIQEQEKAIELQAPETP